MTNNSSLAKKIYLLRNHGLKDRNNCEIFAFNSRLDTIQASIANYKIKNKLDVITKKRIETAFTLDKYLKIIIIFLFQRKKYYKEVFHLYQINVDAKIRNNLIDYLNSNIDTKFIIQYLFIYKSS